MVNEILENISRFQNDSEKIDYLVKHLHDVNAILKSFKEMIDRLATSDEEILHAFNNNNQILDTANNLLESHDSLLTTYGEHISAHDAHLSSHDQHLQIHEKYLELLKGQISKK